MVDEEGTNSDIIRLRAMAEERSEDDPLAAMALDGCADEIARLRKAAMPAPMSVAEAARVLADAVRLQLDVGVMDRATPWRDDGTPSKHDRCRHGRWHYEGCEACCDDHLAKALAEYERALASPEGE